MARPVLCPPCSDGNHERHNDEWNVRTGLLGGEVCPCVGDCKPMEMPEWMTGALDLDPADRGTGREAGGRDG